MTHSDEPQFFRRARAAHLSSWYGPWTVTPHYRGMLPCARAAPDSYFGPRKGIQTDLPTNEPLTSVLTTTGSCVTCNA